MAVRFGAPGVVWGTRVGLATIRPEAEKNHLIKITDPLYSVTW